MNYNKNFQRSRHNTSEHSKTKSKGETACSSSEYSTCSDNPEIDMFSNKQKSQVSRESVILAGHLASSRQRFNTILEDTNISISQFEEDKSTDLNLAILCSESDDVYSDCRDFNSSNDSTIYMNLGKVFNPTDSKSDVSNNNTSTSQTGYPEVTTTASEDFSPAIGILQQRLITIIEEREISNTTIKGLSLNDPHDNTGHLITEIIDQTKPQEEQNNNLARKVLFADSDNVVDNENHKLVLNQNSKTLNGPPVCPSSRKPSDGCYNYNTTESFVLWEKFCETSENLANRRSFSFSQLNSVTESCSGDDEYSTTSCKTVDDMHLSRTSVNKDGYQLKSMRRSRSCESILKEVKNLPHHLYNKILKCVSEEIDKIRTERVVCTCQKWHDKNSNKENQRNRSPKKTTLKLTNKITNINCNATESRIPIFPGSSTAATNRLSPKIANTTSASSSTKNGIRLSPEPIIKSKLSPKTMNTKKLSPEASNRTRLSPGISNQTRLSPGTSNQTRLSPGTFDQTYLSPETASRNLSHFHTSPRTPTTPSKSRYFWNKQIVSPVGEYIRGKRQSPFQSSPSKKK